MPQFLRLGFRAVADFQRPNIPGPNEIAQERKRGFAIRFASGSRWESNEIPIGSEIDRCLTSIWGGATRELCLRHRRHLREEIRNVPEREQVVPILWQMLALGRPRRRAMCRAQLN
jgi:hypothetical protein